MLSTFSLLNQMDDSETLRIERLVQSKVKVNNPVLYYLNSYLLKISPDELQKEMNSFDPQKQPIHDRFIYNCILEYYNLKPIEEKELLLSEVFAAVHTKSFASDLERISELERLFHKMKKVGVEQESSELLFALYQLNIGKPLEVVYHHLYKKYAGQKEQNNNALNHFINLNNLLGEFLVSKNETITKTLILEYKKIRNLNNEYENRILTTILNMSKLILTVICGQDQLLREERQSIPDLFATCESNIEDLPFGMEKFYFQNIFKQLNLFHSPINVNIKAWLKESSNANNFDFPKSFASIIKKKIKSNGKLKKITLNIKNNTQIVKTTTSSLSISGDSLLVHTNI